MSDAPDYYRLVEWAAQRSGVIDERDWEVKKGLDKAWSTWGSETLATTTHVRRVQYQVPTGKTLYIIFLAAGYSQPFDLQLLEVVAGFAIQQYNVWVPSGAVAINPFGGAIRFEGGNIMELWYRQCPAGTNYFGYSLRGWEE